MPPEYEHIVKPVWEEAYLSGSRDAITVVAGNGKEIREVPAFIIHSKGKEL